jgi:hypothetical protein
MILRLLCIWLVFYSLLVLYLFDNVIYVFLFLWPCILVVCLCMTTLTEVFRFFFLSCKGKCQSKTRKDGVQPALFLIFMLFHVLFVLFYIFFCVFLCIFVLFYVLFVLWHTLYCLCVCVCVCVCMYWTTATG